MLHLPLVPTQALTLMNSPWVRSLAGVLAQRIRKETGTPAAPRATLEKLYQLALSRSITPEESQRLGRFMEKQKALLGRGMGTEDRALQEVCLLVLSCNEFVYLD